MKDFLKDCNSYKGRWNRKKYWLYPIAIALIFVLPASIILQVGIGMGNDIMMYFGGGLLAIGYIYMIYVSICAYIKRFHDLGKSGWFTLFMFIPFVNLIFTIWTYFFKGTVGPNKFGPDPLGATSPVSDSIEL